MKSLVTALALVLSTAHASAAPLRMTTVSDCDVKESIHEFLSEQYSEMPFAVGPGVIQRPDGEFAQGVYVIWANPVNYSFSVTIEFPDGIACILGMGGDLSPAHRGPKI